MDLTIQCIRNTKISQSCGRQTIPALKCAVVCQNRTSRTRDIFSLVLAGKFHDRKIPRIYRIGEIFLPVNISCFTVFYCPLMPCEILRGDRMEHSPTPPPSPIFFPPASAVEGIKSVPSVCESVCLLVSALTAQSFDLGSRNSVWGLTFIKSRPSLKVKVIGQRSRSPGQKIAFSKFG